MNPLKAFIGFLALSSRAAAFWGGRMSGLPGTGSRAIANQLTRVNARDFDSRAMSNLIRLSAHKPDIPDSDRLHLFNGHRINLSSCPVAIPSSAKIFEQSKTNYDQVKFKWDDGTHGYEARWHTRTPGAPPEQGDTWVVTRTTPGTSEGKLKEQCIFTGPNHWTPINEWQSAISANQSATDDQKELLKNGHHTAHN